MVARMPISDESMEIRPRAEERNPDLATVAIA
jgi:hypothetical protein